MGLSLSPELRQLVELQITSGRYHTTDLTEALQALREKVKPRPETFVENCRLLST